MSNKATIQIKGPVGCGKSIVSSRIKAVLEREFPGIIVVQENFDPQIESVDYDKLLPWERSMVKETHWTITEATQPE